MELMRRLEVCWFVLHQPIQLPYLAPPQPQPQPQPGFPAALFTSAPCASAGLGGPEQAMPAGLVVSESSGSRQCPYCPRTFPFPSYLQRHITLHTGEKPFRCHSCYSGFTRRSHLKAHMRRKHGPSHQTSPPSHSNSLPSHQTSSSRTFRGPQAIMSAAAVPSHSSTSHHPPETGQQLPGPPPDLSSRPTNFDYTP
ncbi:hypothetical protein Pmani_004059 [Petrolisthes manimaculis]|uniref:C2H2-type domain-containing protein n=1 Tax=Petrolisthes manimaculis TaxID=1843537 RepID=A0AAE1QHC2_9EUCA|nr:hypothetical protein Pmani_004059 [Petrolisthes manimaculis]